MVSTHKSSTGKHRNIYTEKYWWGCREIVGNEKKTRKKEENSPNNNRAKTEEENTTHHHHLLVLKNSKNITVFPIFLMRDAKKQNK